MISRGDKLSWRIVAGAALGAAALTGMAGGAAGASLGMVLGGLFALAIGLPPLVASCDGWRSRWAVCAGVVVGVTLPMLALVGRSKANLVEWLSLAGVVAAFGAAICGLDVLLVAIRVPRLLASALTVVMALAYLTWPIWLSPYLAGGGLGRLVGWLVLIHPGLVANGLLTFTVPWTEQAIAYHLTVLDQDVAIQLPQSGIPSIAVHGAAAVLAVIVSYFAA